MTATKGWAKDIKLDLTEKQNTLFMQLYSDNQARKGAAAGEAWGLRDRTRSGKSFPRRAHVKKRGSAKKRSV